MVYDAIIIDQLNEDELLDELASFLYDAYMHKKETSDVIMTAVDQGQNAEDEDESNE